MSLSEDLKRPADLIRSAGALEEVNPDRKGDDLRSLREAADRIIDTSSFTPHHLRQIVTSLYATQQG